MVGGGEGGYAKALVELICRRPGTWQRANSPLDATEPAGQE